MIFAIRENEVYPSCRWHDWIGDGSILTESPYNYQLVEVPNECADAGYADFINSDGVYTFNQAKYKANRYESMVADRVSERILLHKEFDGEISKANRKIRAGIDVEYWSNVIQIIDNYNDSISNTIYQKDYPFDVVYPDKPTF